MPETKPPYVVNSWPKHGYTWKDILNRLRGIGDRVPSGAARVTIRVLVRDGEPAQWYEPIVERLEPGRAARQFLELLDEEIAGRG